MSQLARKLHTVDYFTLGFGTMVGAGWLILMGDWLERGGPWGAVLGFFIGGAVLLPVAYVYGQLVMAIPDAGSEIAYTARMFPPAVSFFSGWIMMLSYLVVCPWEGVAIGKVAAYIFPRLNALEVYRIAGQPVFLPHLLLGLGLTALITFVNYRGVHVSARFQNWTTFGLLALSVVFTVCALAKGSVANLEPRFSQGGGLVSTLLVLQIVPYFMTGFESVPKCAEEANPEFRKKGFFRAIVAAVLVGIAFYCVIVFIVAYSFPWTQAARRPFATAYTLQQAVGHRWIVDLVLIAALLSLFKIFNGNFLAATRLLFALGRRRMIHPGAARIHPRNQTPSVAVLAIGLLTAAGVCMGNAILIPITEVGSMTSACAWLAACAAYFYMAPTALGRGIAVFGGCVSLALAAMKVLPFVPGHFSLWEWAALSLWLALGFALRRRERSEALAAHS